MKTVLMTKKYWSVASLLIFLFLPFGVAALSSGGLGGYPAYPDPSVQYSESWFIYNLDLGESKDDALILFNTTDEIQTVKLYPVDSVPSNQGNFALEAEDSPRKGIGSWIKLSETLVTLSPGESREIPFTITIPHDTDVGEHSGGIIIQKARPGEVQAETGASIVTRVGIRVYETVPGEIVKDIKLIDFQVKLTPAEDKTSFYDISLTAENLGNVSLKPQVSLNISGWGKLDYQDVKQISYESLAGFIKGQQSFPVHFFSGEVLTKDWQLLRGQKVTTKWEWPKPVFGHFNFQAVLSYDELSGPKTLAGPTVSVWVIPWRELTVLAGLVLLFALFFIFKKIVYSGRRWLPYTVGKNDHLATIAKRSSVSWQRLAKVNKLVKPYLLEPGQKILVPPTFRFPEPAKINIAKAKKDSQTDKIKNDN